MQAHIPPAGFVCVKCFRDTFPEHKNTYRRFLFDPECPVPASSWPSIAGSTTTAAQSAGADARAAQEASTVAVDAGAHPNRSCRRMPLRMATLARRWVALRLGTFVQTKLLMLSILWTTL